MNIQGIQIAQGLLRAVEGKSPSGKGNVSAESEISRPVINSPEAKENKILPNDSNLPTQKGDSFELVYPPFFPVGNTQGIYTVMIEAKSDASSDAAQPQKAEKKPAPKTAEAKTEQPQVAHREDEPRESKPRQIQETSDPGSFLDLKV